MKVKNKNFVGIMMLALMLIFGLSLNAEALIPAYSGTITIANNSTTSVGLGGDITITGTASDMVAGSDIWLTCPSGLKFDTNTTLQIGTNITVSNFSLSNAYYSTDGTRIILTVSGVPAGYGTVAFKSTLSVKPTPTAEATNQNVIGQQFTLTTNVGTVVPGPLDTLLGNIKILEPPEIVSATLVSGTAVDVLFGTNISGTSTALGANAADDTTDGNPVFLITTGNGTATAITTVSGTSARDATNNALVHITGITGTIYAGNVIKFRTAGSKDITNALGAINAPNTTTGIPINPESSSISSVAIVGAPAYVGDGNDTAFYTRNTFTTTITGTAGGTIKTRIPSGTTAVTGVTWTGGGATDSTGGVGTILIASGGSSTVIVTLSQNSLVSTGNKVLTATVQASLDNFTNSTPSTSGDLVIDRTQPKVVATSCASPDRNHIAGQFNEEVNSATVVPSGFTLAGTNSGVAISNATLGSDKKTFTLTTGLLAAATDNTVAATTTVKDLAGNRALTTASSTFLTQGPATTSTSITGLNPNSAEAGSLIVSNGDTISVTITGPTGGAANARVVNSADNTITGITTGAVSLSETGVGVYSGTVIVTTIGTGISGVKVQGTMDGFAQVTTSSESLTVDNTAPTVTSAQGAGTTAMLVTFSEPMDTNVALTATASYSIIGSLSGTRAPNTTGIFRSPNQVVLRTNTPTIAGETVIVDVAATGVRDLTFNNVSFASDTNLVDRAQYIGPAADTVAPTILGAPVVAIGDTKVTVYITDNSGSAAVDISSNVTQSATKITSVTKGGNNVNGTPSNDTVNVACIFTPIAGTFPAGDYVVNLNAADLAGNPAVLSATFTVHGDVSCSANPTTVTLIGGTSTITASGGLAPYTAAITSGSSIGTLTGSGSPWTLTMSGSTAGSVTVRITDSQTPGRTCDVTVAYAPCELTVAATKSAVNGEKISVSATGGVLPYVYELTTTTATGAAIDPVSGDYLAPSASGSTVAVETETIKATDANGCSGTTTVKISANAVEVTTSGSGTNSVTISGGTGATFAIKDGVGAVTAGGVYTSTEDGVGIVRVTKGTETADVIIKVASGGICTVKSPVPVQDVNMDGAVNINDLTPVIDKILE